MVGTFIALPLTTKLVAKFGKKNVSTYSLVISIAAYAVMVFFPSKNPYIYMALSVVSGVGVGFYNMIVWALVGDVIDYQEYIKNLSSNPLAKEVKLADLEHNMDLKRLPTLEEKDLERNRKYQIAYHYLINNK